MADEEEVDVGVSARHQMVADRLQRVRDANRVPRVRVLPRDDEVRKHIKHYPSQVGFPAEGSVEWPYDAFTKKRIRDGAVTVDEQTGEQRDAARAASTGTPAPATSAPARQTGPTGMASQPASPPQTESTSAKG